MFDGNQPLPSRVVDRLVAYRRHLRRCLVDGKERVYSHELAGLEGVTPAQVRRDLMNIAYSGSPARGYDIAGLIERIATILDARAVGAFALVGVGHLGGAILDYLARQHPEFEVAAFDVNPTKTGRVIHGCRCYALDELESVAARQPMGVGVITVPAQAAQEVAGRLIGAGVHGLLNFAPVRLRVPADVHVEDVDITLLLEKVAFFAGQRAGQPEASE